MIAEKNRSYQDISASYVEVTEQVLADYDSAFVTWENTGKVASGGVATEGNLQYKAGRSATVR